MKQTLLKLVLIALIVIIAIPFANSQTVSQTRSLTGIVVDQLNDPIIGASVAIVGTTNGAITGIDGTFALNNVISGQEINVSYIGYKTQQIVVGDQTFLQIILTEDTKLLDEVVVIGYGVQRKSDVTGAIATVKGDVLASRSVENIQQALQGKAAGVQVMSGSSAPGSVPAVRIRGISSNSSGASEPLYVVDGLKVKDIAYLDPNNIESMEILKDGASAAIYGVEAGNGVVLITTKNGVKGENRIFYDFLYGQTSLAHKSKMMNARQYVDYNKAAGNAISMERWDGVTDTDWFDELYGDGGSFQRHTVGLDAGNDKGSLYVSASYLHNDGMYYGEKDYMKRLTAQLNATYNIKPWLEFTTSNSFEDMEFSKVGDGIGKQSYNSPNFFDPLTPAFYSKDNLPAYMQALINANGDEMFMKNEKGDYVAIPQYCSDSVNPLTYYYSQDSRHKDFNLRGISALNLKPFKGFVFTSRIGYRFGSEDYSYYGVPVYFSVSPRQKLSYEAETVTGRFYEWENFANYNQTFGKHNVYAMAGIAYSESRRNYTQGTTDTFTNDTSNFHYLDYSSSDANDGVGGKVDEAKRISYFGRAGYSFDNRYMIQVNFRADAFDSSKLSEESRWGYFPSVSVGWTASNEEFMKEINPNVLNYFKFRASFGVNGNINVLNNYRYASSLSLPNYYPIGGSLVNTISPSSVLANPSLNWEESKQTDVGIDVRSLNDRFSLTVDYFNKNTTGQLVKMTPPLSTGTTEVWRNVGKVQNYGFEFDFGWQDRINDFSYSIHANLATLHNEVKSLGGASRIEDTYSNGFVYFDEGQPVWSYYGYDYQGVNPSDGSPVYRDVNKDGIINEKDKVFFGSAIPKFTYGITLYAAYKGFDFTAFGSGSQGGMLALSNRGRPGANLPAEYWTESWDVKGAGAKYPHPDLNDANLPKSSLQLSSGSYFKIKQLQLGYTFPDTFTKKALISKLRVFVSLDNFFTFTSYIGMDPESLSAAPPDMKGNISETGALGMDYGEYPTPKTLTFGLNLSF
jgi:TonB-linked SusC/RagA family outer membrane protein